MNPRGKYNFLLRLSLESLWNCSQVLPRGVVVLVLCTFFKEANMYNRKIRGATMIEYVLLAGLVSIAAAALLTPLGTKIAGVFSTVTSTLPWYQKWCQGKGFNEYKEAFMANNSKRKIKGATMIEYVLLAGLVSIAAAALLTPLGTKIGAVFSSVTSTLPWYSKSVKTKCEGERGETPFFL